MSAEQWFKLADKIIDLLRTIIWPCILLVIIMYFKESLKRFLENLGELTFKAGGIEASIKKQQIEAAVQLGAASEKQLRELPTNKSGISEKRIRQTVAVINQAINKKSLKLLSAKVLWVDDNPNNNLYERRSLEALDIRFWLSTSTEDALKKIELYNNFNLIISDMERPPDSLAGYTLLKSLRDSGNLVPFIIYTGSNAPELKAQALVNGAQGCTNDPIELFELVINSLNER